MHPSRRSVVAAMGVFASLRAQDTPSGTLIIRSQAEVQIRLNGRLVGRTGPDGTLQLKLSPGAYTLDVWKPGYEPYQLQVVVTDKQTTEASFALRIIHPSPAPPTPVPVPNKVTGRALLPQTVKEAEGYGLYSYLLFSRRPQFGLSKRRSRYIAAIEAYLEIENVTSVLRYAERREVNITYLPVLTTPKEPAADSILQVYDYARAQKMLLLANIQSGDGPFIIATRQPFSNWNSLPGEHLIQDLSTVPARVVELWVILFLHYASRERFWERTTRNEFLLSLRTYIASGGEKVEHLATAFAAVLWQFNQR